MLNTRPSVPGDVPAQRELWALAFGDTGDYVDNFYHNYYRPDRVLVLEEDGVIRAMTAWFDTTFVLPGQGEYRAAYLYAVATHPDCRGRGLAAKLLADADAYFRAWNIPAVTTVPAQPSLHRFFGANGFRECFVLNQEEWRPSQLTVPEQSLLHPVSPEAYGRVREALLADIPHIAYPEDALSYQGGCCALSKGGLFSGETPHGPVCLCAEGAGDGLFILKEYLGSEAARSVAMHSLPHVVPAQRWLVRTPAFPQKNHPDSWEFAMLKWLDQGVQTGWNWDTKAYLGLAFD